MLKSIKNIFFKSEDVFSNCRLISKVDPLVFSKGFSFKKEYIYNTSIYTQEMLDAPKKAIQVFRIYDQIKLKTDSLIFESTDLSAGVFVLNKNIFGREYSKTFQMISKVRGDDREVLFQVVDGEGFVILENSDSTIVEIIKVERLNFVLIPKGKSFVFINSSLTKDFVCLYLSQKEIEFVKKKNGFGASIFYTKNGFVKNKNAKSSFAIEDIKGDYTQDYFFDKERSLYDQFMEIPEKFNFLK